MKEYKIGEVFEYKGKRYEVVSSGSCGTCDLKNDCDDFECTDLERRDGQNVNFKEITDESATTM